MKPGIGALPIPDRSEFEAAWARRSYLRYCQLVHHGAWVPGPHHKLICDALDKVTSGEITRLMICMPPRHGKSMTVTESYPSYFLGKYPTKRVIEVSYNDEFARKFGRRNRDKVRDFGGRLFGVGLSQLNANANNWDLSNGIGGMISVGFGGAATGEGADLLVIDDPVKNRMEADSITSRQHIWDEYQSTFITRIHPGASIIVIMTRWHEDDLCGRLLNPEYGPPDAWTVLRLPAESEGADADPLHRPEGAPLWPEHGYGKEWLNQQRQAVGSYAWAGLYQQRPAPAEGGILRRGWFKFYTDLPSQISKTVQSWDCTFKDGDNTDFVAGHVWARAGGNFYLVDRVHDHMGITDTMQAIRTLSYKHPEARAKLIEDKANGPAVIELLRKEISGILPVNPKGGKIDRAQAVAPYAEAGNIFLPHPSRAPWVHDMLEEFAAFPNGAHDDDVDAMTQAIIYMTSGIASSPPPRNYGNDRESYWMHGR